MGHASKRRELLVGTDQRITSGPAATAAASRQRKSSKRKQAGYMAAPERFAETSDSSCTAGAVHTWPFATFRCWQHFGRFSNRPFRVKRFQTIRRRSVSISLTGSCFSSESAQGPSIMGFEDEVEQSLVRPCRQCNDRSKRTCELTSSIVPRGTPFHRLVELEFPPIEADLARLSSRCRG